MSNYNQENVIHFSGTEDSSAEYDGRRQVIESVGSGAESMVYRVDGDLAIKISKATDGREPEVHDFLQSRAEREWRISRLLGDHDNLLTVLTYGKALNGDSTNWHPASVVPFIPGITAKKLQNTYFNGGPMPEDVVKALFTPAGPAIDHMHRREVAHGDIKLENLLTLIDTQHGKIKDTVVFDYGTAAVAGEPPRDFFTGTPQYAPYYDQQEKYILSPANDVYAAAGGLYEALTGFRPFDGLDVHPAFAHALHEAPSFKERGVSNISADIEETIFEALDKKPDNRPTILELFSSLGEPEEAMESHQLPQSHMYAGARAVSQAVASPPVFASQ